MSRLLVVVAIAACGSSTPKPVLEHRLEPGTIVWPASLDHTSTPATHREAALQLLDKAGLREAMVAMQDVALAAQIKANPALAPVEAKLREFLQRYASFDALEGDFVALYVSRFTELQLRQMIAFYATPTGQLALKELPRLVNEGAKIGTENVEKHRAELIEMLKQP